MSIKKVWIDEDACTGCGLCEDTCPDVFEVNDVAVVKEDADFNEFEEEIKEAAEDCPSEAIHYEEE
ncbi:MAG TPA: ferredoxin [Candidatus Aerophobetes bacterium]|uniref:Ferredoxin n=1 Tax=Aerophobetes bacterium TaxID=2030807 RepID=A0A7V5HYD8_UNCAE|nr:ferredoxin [Candidatus Aerophobetes bacterium]